MLDWACVDDVQGRLPGCSWSAPRIVGDAKAKGLQHDREADARRNHSAPFRSPRELGLSALGLARYGTGVANALLRERLEGFASQLAMLDVAGCPVPACSLLLVSPHIHPPLSDLGPGAGSFCVRTSRQPSRWPPLVSSSRGRSTQHALCHVQRVAVLGASSWRKPGGFSVLRPPSRNVKLTLFSYCKALLAWCHGLLAGMVRYGGGVGAGSNSCLRRSSHGPRTASGQMGLAANIPQQGCSCQGPPSRA